MAKRAGAGWSCQRCGRQFANANQAHSCTSPVAVATHFEGRPPWMRAAFDRIAKELGASTRISGVAKGIHFAARSTFAGITTTREKLRVEFLLGRVVNSPRVFKIEQLGPTRIAHHVELTNARGADAELLAWLKTARDERR